MSRSTESNVSPGESKQLHLAKPRVDGDVEQDALLGLPGLDQRGDFLGGENPLLFKVTARGISRLLRLLPLCLDFKLDSGL